jgi:hypothetical protein
MHVKDGRALPPSTQRPNLKGFNRALCFRLNFFMQVINNKLVTVGKVSPRFTAIPVQLALPRALEKVPAGQSVSGRRKIVSIGRKEKYRRSACQ